MDQKVDWAEIGKLEKRLGFGSYGCVHKTTWKTKDIAAKEIARPDIFAKEIENLSSVSHPNIVKYLGNTTDEANNNYVLMEYADCGSVYSFLHDKQNEEKKVSFVGLLNWMLQCAMAIEYLHSKNILHRDLKTHNLLLFDKYRTLKLCDFGTVRELASTMTSNTGTVLYMAPEVYSSKYSEKCDVYSFGIIMWELMSRQKPFSHLENSEIQARMYLVGKGERPPMDQVKKYENSAHIRVCIPMCWHQDPDMRPTMSDVVRILNLDPRTPLRKTLDIDYKI